jgi:predicted nucleotidyltransferase
MLGSLLFGEYRKRTLGLLLLNPEADFHVRELARLTGTSAGTLHKELAKLCAGGILQRKQIGNQVHYSANISCPIFEELASILRKTSGFVDVLAKALVSLESKIDFAFVFGSVASGDQQSFSDVDVMLIGNLSFSETVQALHPTQTILQRELNPVVYSQEEFQRRIKNNDTFIKEVLAKPKLFIIGSENELRQFT